MTNIHNSSYTLHVGVSGHSSLAFKFLLFWILVTIGRPQDVFPTLKILHLGDIAAIGTLCSLFTMQPGQKNNGIFKYAEVKVVTLILLLMVVLIPFATVKSISINFLKDIYLKDFLLFIIAVMLTRTIKEIEYLSWVFVFSALLLSIAAFLMKGDMSSRIQVGSMLDPNDLAMILVIIMPIAIMFSFYRSGFQRVLGIITSIMSSFGIVLTQSRGGLLGLLVIMFLIFFNRTRFKIKYLAVLLLLVVMFFSFAPANYWDRMKTMTEKGNTGSERTTVWKRSIKMVCLNPFGYGVNNFVSAYGRYIATDATAESTDSDGWGIYAWKTAHNSFVLIAVELGVLGLAFYVFLIYKTYNNFKKIKKIFPSNTDLYRYAEFFRISLVGFIVCSFFLSQSYSIILLLIIAISSVMMKVIAKETEICRGTIS